MGEKWYSQFENNEDFNNFLEKKMMEYTGTSETGKALKRYSMVLEWREEKDVCN